MNNCRVCGAGLGNPIYAVDGPSVTSLATFVDIPTKVFACLECGHISSNGFANLELFYDTEYKISLESDEHDQLYEMRQGKPWFRTDQQAQLVLEKVLLPTGALVLDYGAAKSTTLRKMASLRPDLAAYAFDVSNDYLPYWQSWLQSERYATYKIPIDWQEKFDLVTAFFVFEHVAKPLDTLRAIRIVLKPGGVLFLIVPDFTRNPGDLLVLDHVNHFTSSSLERALINGGFENIVVETEAFAGSLLVTARSGTRPAGQAGGRIDVTPALEIASFWSQASRRLDQAAAGAGGRECAIYGAGVYGAFVASRVQKWQTLVCFIDRNPHLSGHFLRGVPVFLPENLPDRVETVYAGLNPLKARAILADLPEWRGRPIEMIFLDGAR